ncbi:MAG: hypothetical protein K0R34_588 [Herbinix sp.]|jgi:hypothetical protein|nr:hypothetical protein [Herbinix sp.]
MAEIKAIANIDLKNTQNVGAVKKNSDSTDFSSLLGETKSLDEIFDKAAKEYNVSVELLKAIGKAESNFKSDAVSRCGAQGVMQLMPATAKSLGVTDSFDAEQNIMGGAKYISGLLKKYDGNTKLALAAYNAGSGNVAKYGGIPPFEETQNYVKKVMNYMQQGTDTKGALVNVDAPVRSTSQTRSAVAAPAPVQNNYAYIIANSVSGTEPQLESLDTLFSYDDYLEFLDLLLNEEEEQKEQSVEEEKSVYAAQDITYNVPVMNLLKDQKFL